MHPLAFITGGCIIMGTFFKSMVPDIFSNILSETHKEQKEQRDIFNQKGFLNCVKLKTSK